MDREAAYYNMFRGTVHVIVGSGLTIAGAVACLYFTRLPYFQTLGVPAALGVLVTLAAALTLGPAVLTIASRFGLLEPKRKVRARGWRRIGTAIVRWPGPDPGRVVAVALIGLLALPGYKTSYDARPYLPDSAPANVGYAAAERHFSEARLNPELLMIETDHDMRNPSDMLVLERVAKAVLHTPGIVAGAVDHPAPGHADHPQLHPISDQRAKRQPDHEPRLSAGPGRGSAQAGRRDQQDDRHPQTTGRRCSRPVLPPPTSRPRRSTKPSRS